MIQHSKHLIPINKFQFIIINITHLFVLYLSVYFDTLYAIPQIFLSKLIEMSKNNNRRLLNNSLILVCLLLLSIIIYIMNLLLSVLFFCSRSNNLDFYTAYTYNKKLTQHTMGLYITYYYLYYYTFNIFIFFSVLFYCYLLVA